MTKFFKNFKNYHPKDWDNKIRSEFNKKEYLNLFSEQEKIKISPFYHNKINLTSNFPNEIINLQLIDATMEIGQNIAYINNGIISWSGNKEELLESDNEQLNNFVFASQLFKRLKKI